MNEAVTFPQQGGCVCGETRFQIRQAPLFIHCCHCTWCQRETGSAFALNALIETSHVELAKDTVEVIHTPSQSGKGQDIFRCKVCKVAVWSHYALAQGKICFVRVGTLDNATLFAPDIHIFTSTRLSWVQLPLGIPAVEDYYRRSQYWPRESLDRYRQAVAV